LIVMLHGFGNNKHEWESLTADGDNADKWHWNNTWFAEHGFYVLTYTARGFLDQGKTRADEPDTPPGAPFGSYTGPGTPGTVHLKSRDFEIKDTQWLGGAHRRRLSRHRSEPGRGHGRFVRRRRGVDASEPGGLAFGPRPQSRAANLAAPGRRPQVPVDRPGLQPGPERPQRTLRFEHLLRRRLEARPTIRATVNPLGVIKYSYATGFIAEGIAGGFFETTPENIPGWYGDAVVAGDPYDAGTAGTDRPVYIPDLRHGLTELRGSYYQDETWATERDNREVAHLLRLRLDGRPVPSGWKGSASSPT